MYARLCVCFMISVFLTLIYSLLPERKVVIEPEINVKYILYWNPMYDSVDFYLGQGAAIFENCIYKKCHATKDKSLVPIDKFDAFIFHGREYTEKKHGKPGDRNRRQIYVFALKEPPPYTTDIIGEHNHFYNWTMTYRLDTDIPWRYGFVERAKTDYQLPSAEEIEARPKKIAWFVSHCKTSSKREDIVKKLSKYIQVDIYGKCGDLTCGSRMDKECYGFLQQNHKFYLSFENSICEDYITEKVYNVLAKNVVPIVFGGADYSKFLPPNSVINVMNYTSVKELANYIQYLDSHTEEYLKFFEWKKDYVLGKSNSMTLCSLCRKLHEQIEPKTYGDIDLWWRGENGKMCARDNSFLENFLK